MVGLVAVMKNLTYSSYFLSLLIDISVYFCIAIVRGKGAREPLNQSPLSLLLLRWQRFSNIRRIGRETVTSINRAIRNEQQIVPTLVTI
jgi:hypothetical protein